MSWCRARTSPSCCAFGRPLDEEGGALKWSLGQPADAVSEMPIQVSDIEPGRSADRGFDGPEGLARIVLSPVA
jgi:hypothetical protein